MVPPDPGTVSGTVADDSVNCGNAVFETRYVSTRSGPGTFWYTAPSETPHGRGYDPDNLNYVWYGTSYLVVSQKRALILVKPVVPAMVVTKFGSAN